MRQVNDNGPFKRGDEVKLVHRFAKPSCAAGRSERIGSNGVASSSGAVSNMSA
jgi:hypothetical protein